jgi:hypothetical protein
MAYIDLTNILNSVKRLLSKSIVSGTYADSELVEIVNEANTCIGIDWEGFGSYTITASGIEPSVSGIDHILLALKTASLANLGLVQESVGDAILIRAGKITLDTSKSLRYKGIEADRLEKEYTRLITRLQITGNTGSGNSTLGYRIDNYIETASQVNQIDSDSL